MIGSIATPETRPWEARRYTRKVLKQARQQNVDAGAVTDRWLQEQKRDASRVEFHGQRLSWPIQKLANDTPSNRPLLRDVSARRN